MVSKSQANITQVFKSQTQAAATMNNQWMGMIATQALVGLIPKRKLPNQCLYKLEQIKNGDR